MRALFAGSVVAVLTLTSEAYACGQTPAEPKLDGVPADGDVDVPTDVVPYFAYTGRRMPPDGDVKGRFTLTANDGTTMLARPRPADDSNYELVPDDPLQPNTKYVLHAEFEATTLFPAGSDDLQFTTGDGPVKKTPETPSARIIHYTLDKSGDCGLPKVGTCVSVGDDRTDVVVTLFDASHTLIGTFGDRGSFFTPINITAGFSQCVEVRARALNGVLSEPIKLCDSTFSTLDIHDTDRIDCSSDGLKSLAPSPNYVPLSAPPVGANDGKKPTSDEPAAHDAGVRQADADVADAEVTDASPIGYIKGKTPGSGGCRATQHGSPVPIALLLLSLLALRRRTMGG